MYPCKVKLDRSRRTLDYISREHIMLAVSAVIGILA